jgi:hypothetical protein
MPAFANQRATTAAFLFLNSALLNGWSSKQMSACFRTIIWR